MRLLVGLFAVVAALMFSNGSQARDYLVLHQFKGWKGDTFAFGASNPASAISTYNSWDGSSDVVEFGCPDTTTYGQVITIPSGHTHLGNFHFSWRDEDTGSMVVRGEVYAWDGTKANAMRYMNPRPRPFPSTMGSSTG